MNNLKEVKNLINKDAGLEANILTLICALYLTPLLLAYLIIKFVIVKPIIRLAKYLIGVIKSK